MSFVTSRRSLLQLIATFVASARTKYSFAAELVHSENDAAKTATLPYRTAEVIDRSSLTGKILCGYQGWFNTEGDGAGRGFAHWARGGRRPEPETISVELWPDLSEFSPEERFATGFQQADGRPAEVFSSFLPQTVRRHFDWMKQYGIDGVFLQRFLVQTSDEKSKSHCDRVLENTLSSADATGRVVALMYDLSGVREGGVSAVLSDLRDVCKRFDLLKHPRYLHHDGRPVISVWGVGFNDNRRYTVEECGQLIDALKADSEIGQLCVMIGTPTGWRKLDRDSVNDPAVTEVFAKADIISPWTVGRSRNLKDVERHRAHDWEPDLQQCHANGQTYLPVVFPGFSWSNLRRGSRFDDIPRLKGDFLWKQMTEAIAAGATCLYVAMFDEVDEGTAIFKCTNDTPASISNQFLTYEGLPSDHYLKLTGLASAMLRKEIEIGDWRKYL